VKLVQCVLCSVNKIEIDRLFFIRTRVCVCAEMLKFTAQVLPKAVAVNCDHAGGGHGAPSS